MIIDGSLIKKTSMGNPINFIKNKKFIFLNITKDDDFRDYDIFYILAPNNEEIKKGF